MSVAPRTAALMSAHWDSRAYRFEGAASHNRDRGAWREVLAAAVGQDVQRIVDMGCGTGACAVLLAGMGHHVIGVDGSSAMLAEARLAAAREGVHVDFIHADMDHCGLTEGSAEVVTLRNVLWTLENPSEALFLAAQLLRPGGKIMISDGIWRRAPDSEMGSLVGHLPNAHGVSEAEARDWLRRAGFGGIKAWQDRFLRHPYGGIYDEAETPIPFFVLTAIKAESARL